MYSSSTPFIYDGGGFNSLRLFYLDLFFAGLDSIKYQSGTPMGMLESGHDLGNFSPLIEIRTSATLRVSYLPGSLLPLRGLGGYHRA
jgi:hypothetical protein